MFNIPKVSVIVPVYNAEEYLNRCIDTLINQTLKDIEIILVNDGSKDKSLSILEQYKKLDRRIVLIDKEDTGVSDTRNKGVHIAKGEYIFFVDSDDWIELDTLENMYNVAIKDDIDVIMCSYIREFGNHSKEKVINLDDQIVYENQDIKELHRKIVGPLSDELAKSEDLDSLGTVWAKLYKSNLIKDNQITFVDLKEIGSAEDTLFNIFLFKYVNRVKYINKPYYHYWKNNSSSVTSGYNPNLKEQRKSMFNYIQKFIDENNLGEKFCEALQNRICMSVLGLGLNECNKNNKISFGKKINNIKNILNDEVIINAYKTFNENVFPIHWKLFYKFNKNRQAILTFCMLNVIEFLRTRV